MTQKITSEESQNEPSWEEAVSRFLEEHPDYFQRHPEVLANLKLEHEVGARAVSLIERQVRALREQNQALSRQLRELVTIARENDLTGSRLHRFATAMLDAHALEDVLDGAHERLRQEFKLDAVAIRLLSQTHAGLGRPELVPEDDRKLQALLKQFGAGKPICGGRFEESLTQYLFGEAAREVRSSALIPLGHKAPRGVLALGSADPRRFHPGMGTVYLTKLGELLIHAFTRFLR